MNYHIICSKCPLAADTHVTAVETTKNILLTRIMLTRFNSRLILSPHHYFHHITSHQHHYFFSLDHSQEKK